MRSVVDLPHDILAEKSLIGCLIIDGGAFDEIADLSMRKEDFFHPQYGIIFEALKTLAIEQKPIDFITICSKLNETNKLDIVGGKDTILSIVEDQASAANMYHYAKIVKDKANIRGIIHTANKIAEKGMQHVGRVDDFISDVESSFFRLTNDAKSGGMQRLNDCLKTNIKMLEDASLRPGEILGLSTGYKKLDELLLGMQAGQLIVLAARPAMGKTVLGLNVAINSCARSGLPIAIFSLEMLSHELSLRILSRQSRVDSKKMKRKDFLDTDLRNIGRAIQELSTMPIFINDAGDVALSDIQSYCRKIKSEHGLGMVMIDYLQLMRSHSNNPSREQQISEISRGLKSMAKELQCPVLALSQLNRGVETRPNKRPTTADLRESGAIEQDADIVMFIYRDEVYNPDTKDKGIAEIIIGKNRSGETGTVKLAFIGMHSSFEELAPNYQSIDSSYPPPFNN